MPKVPEAHLESRRQQVLDAAAACFARNGFHQTTMDNICREAGLSAGAVYRYFRSKEEIIQTLAQVSLQRSLALIEAAKAEDSTQAVMDWLAETFFPMVGASEALPEMCMNVHLWSEALRDPHIQGLLTDRMASVRRAFSDLISRAQARGEIDPALDPESVARLMMAMYTGLNLQAALGTNPDIPGYVAAAKAMASGLFRKSHR